MDVKKKQKHAHAAERSPPTPRPWGWVPVSRIHFGETFSCSRVHPTKLCLCPPPPLPPVQTRGGHASRLRVDFSHTRSTAAEPPPTALACAPGAHTYRTDTNTRGRARAHAHAPQVVPGAGHELVPLGPLGLLEVPQEVLPGAPRHLPEVLADRARAAVLPAEPGQRQGVVFLGRLDLSAVGGAKRW